ncbi:MAG: type II toxin-antitoxin system VapC family toxin [Proteobacteria bacterium]|nr:type II toxin-antitoxin system VapC family toxin [Pseudomonadota bacterium]
MEILFLDTNAYAAYRAGDQRILSALGQAEAIHLSLFVLAELLTGFRGGQREAVNRRELDLFLRKPGVQLTMPSRRTAEYFALIKNRLRAKGTPIPINDVWIAAHCLEHGALLISADAHFDHVEGLRRG